MRIAKIINSPNKRMSGRELRRLRVLAGLSENELSILLDTYRQRIQRWEKMAWFELHPMQMKQLLKVLGAK